MFSVSLIVPLLGMVAPGTAPPQKSAPAAEPVQEIILSRVGKGWTIHFFPDGRAHAQYGALAGDGASVPEGTVAFDALVAAVQRLRVEKRVHEDTQVAVRRKGDTSARSFYISDDNLFRYLVASFRGKWRQDLGGTRFQELLKSHPIYPDDDSR
jgi:hypothetical protein